MRPAPAFLLAAALVAPHAAQQQEQGEAGVPPGRATVVWTTREEFAAAPMSSSQRINLDLDGSPGDVRLRKLAATGVLGDGVAVVTDDLLAGSGLTAAANPARGEYLAVWATPGVRVSDIAGRVLGTDGAPIGPRLDLAGGPGRQFSPAVAFDPGGRRYLLVYGTDEGHCMLVARLLAEDGSPAGRDAIVGECAAANADIVLSSVPGGGFVLLWTAKGRGGDELRSRALASDGKPAGGTATLVAARRVRHPALAFGARRKEFLAAWEDQRGAGAEIRACRVAPDGARLGDDFAITEGGGGKGRPTVAWIGSTDRFFLAWEDARNAPAPARQGNVADLIREQATVLQGADLYARTLPAGGGTDRAESLVIAKPRHQQHPVAGWAEGTDQVLLLWEDARRTYENWDIAGVVLEQDGSWGTGELMIDGAPDEQVAPVLVPGGGRFLALWQGQGPDRRRAKVFARVIGERRGAEGVIGARVDSGMRWASWERIDWTGTAPAGTRIRARVRSAASGGTIEQATWSEFLEAGGGTLVGMRERWLEIEVRLESHDGMSTPALHDLSVTYGPGKNPLWQ